MTVEERIKLSRIWGQYRGRPKAHFDYRRSEKRTRPPPERIRGNKNVTDTPDAVLGHSPPL